MLGQNSTHANFSVDDMAAAKDFYVGKLGFQVVKENDAGMVLQSGTGTKVNIYYRENHSPWDATVFGITVDDVPSAVAELADSGIQVEKLPGTDENGVMSDPQMGDAAWLKDPAGNWLCISNAV